jgi:hypothetical protein
MPSQDAAPFNLKGKAMPAKLLYPKALRDIADKNMFTPMIEKADPERRELMTVILIEIALDYLSKLVAPNVLAGHLYRWADHFAAVRDDRD